MIEEIRNVAKSYRSHWNWEADEYTEENCHTFLFNLLHQVNLADIHILNDGHFSRYYASAKRNSTIVTAASVGNTVLVPVPILNLDYKQAKAIAGKMKKVKANAERLNRVIKRK